MAMASWIRTISGIALVLFIIGITGTAHPQSKDSCEAHAQDKLPKFRIAQRHDLKDGFEIVISMSPEDVSQEHLVAVGCKLGRQFRTQPFLMVWFLDNQEIAKVWQFQTDGSSRERNLALRGSYTFDRTDNRQSLTWFNRRPSDIFHKIKIDLGPAPPKP